jgi:hypothetical protein
MTKQRRIFDRIWKAGSYNPQASRTTSHGTGGLWDVACERQIELRGPDAERLLQMTSPRDLSRMKTDQCFYVPIVLKLAEDRFWVSIADKG